MSDAPVPASREVLREDTLTIPLGAIRVLRTASPSAPACRVLALHGWLDNAASFVPLAPLLQGIELVVPDLPGHGRSAHLAAGADYSFAGAVNAVLDIADALGWPRFALLGHSMGAGIGSLLAAACPERIERFVAIEALGALAETPERTVQRMRDAVAATRALPGKRLRVFPDIATAVRVRMQANALSEPVARLLVERGLVPAPADASAQGYVWSSDPRLTLPTMLRTTEAQVRNLVEGIGCPTRVIYADPAQPYLPDPLRRDRAALLPDGDMRILAGGHHLHMENPDAVAAAIGDFLTAGAA
ncbi:alpha/beta fold hydrolase [Cognatiluteimonas telluris]|jgi:pimeloyl-ACP methyl ester carboxylesterase|uniref:alpha/beta fold hydrolase n=1 Tax=Cognatiluteimonas telluris TaxID=1104775 RepID=UPI00140C216E|nr:alpha/beta hydrolase [Lysobacter telluris]